MQDELISREAVCDYIAEYVNDEYSTQAECDMVDAMIDGIQHLPSVTQKPGKYTADELREFADGISLSLCSKKSAQHWSYDEETAEQIRWLECLHSKVMTDIADTNCGAKMESEGRHGRYRISY